MEDMIGRVLKDRYEILEKIEGRPYAGRKYPVYNLMFNSVTTYETDISSSFRVCNLEIYRALDREQNMLVTVRMIYDERYGNDFSNFTERYKKMESFCSFNLISVKDVGETNNFYYWVTEYVEGTLLKDYIRQRKALSWQEAMEYALHLLKVLLYAKKQTVYIYPHSVILDKEKIMKVELEPAAGGTTGEELDTNSWYAVVGIIYEMLTGRELTLSTAWGINVLGWEYVEDEKEIPGIPEGLKQIMRRMCSRCFGCGDMPEEVRRIIHAIEQLKKYPKMYKGRELKVDSTRGLEDTLWIMSSNMEDAVLLKENLTSCVQEKDSLDIQNKALTKENKALSKENEGLQKAKHALSDKNKLLYDGVKKLQSDTQTLRTKNTALQTELQRLRAEIESYISDSEKLQTQNKKLLTEKRNLAAEVRELETIIQQMRESRPVQVMTFFPLNDEEKANLLEQQRNRIQ